MRATLAWLHARADNVAVGLLTAMFFSFMAQIVSRYILHSPISSTIEICLTCWIWLVFWGGAFLVDDHRHVKFDVLYLVVRPQTRRIFGLISALAIVVGLSVSLPATVDYVTFMKIETSAILGIRLDYVFSVYAVFSVAVIVRYAWRALRLVRGDDTDAVDGGVSP